MYRYFFKRLIDLIVSVTVFVLLLPAFALLYVVLAIYYKGDPFFYQKRPGYHTRIFSIVKFKSMIDAFDEAGNPLPDTERLTKVGYFLRKTSLDELPQLLNVIKGDMALIGPRPLLVQYLDYYTEEEGKRHSVRPGITGLSQVSGRNYLSWNDKLRYDIEYVDNLSFLLDLQIIYKTIKKVFKSSDVVVIPSTIGGRLDVERKNMKL